MLLGVWVTQSRFQVPALYKFQVPELTFRCWERQCLSPLSSAGAVVKVWWIQCVCSQALVSTTLVWEHGEKWMVWAWTWWLTSLACKAHKIITSKSPDFKNPSLHQTLKMLQCTNKQSKHHEAKRSFYGIGKILPPDAFCPWEWKGSSNSWPYCSNWLQWRSS